MVGEPGIDGLGLLRASELGVRILGFRVLGF